MECLLKHNLDSVCGLSTNQNSSSAFTFLVSFCCLISTEEGAWFSERSDRHDCKWNRCFVESMNIRLCNEKLYAFRKNTALLIYSCPHIFFSSFYGSITLLKPYQECFSPTCHLIWKDILSITNWKEYDLVF